MAAFPADNAQGRETEESGGADVSDFLLFFSLRARKPFAQLPVRRPALWFVLAVKLAL